MNILFTKFLAIKVMTIQTNFYQLDLSYRSVYGLLDLIGDLGGVSDLIIKFLGIFMLPISNFSFVFKALENLYLVKS